MQGMTASRLIIRNLQGIRGESARPPRVSKIAMAEPSGNIESVIAEVMEKHLPQMKQELAERLAAEVPSQNGGSSGSSAAELLKAVSAIHAGSTQKEILRALLDGTTQFCGRAALFVVKAGAANGWQGRGFESSDHIKDFSLDVSSKAVAQVLEIHTRTVCKAQDMDSQFIEQFCAPSDETVLLLPLLLKDKVAALVYADCGSDGRLDQAGVELLVATTGAWLEVASLRKHAAKGNATEHDSEPAPEPQQVSSFSDPFAGHAPAHAMVASAGAGSSEGEVTNAVSSGSAAAAAAPALDPFAHLSVEDADVHRKAQRFARLLIDEVKLYNQAKVAEGRKKKDLYDRLKEDIEKSRSTFTKRYGNTVAASGDYLNAEIIRSLAGDDASVLGANFRR